MRYGVSIAEGPELILTKCQELIAPLASSPRSTAPSTNCFRPWAIVSIFFLEIALIVAYAVESSIPPRRFKIRMTCS